MNNLVPSFYKRYGMHVNYARAFPLAIDGLKPVERRVLLSAYDIARDRSVKSAKVDGYCIGNYHPHGSVYGTIVQMVHQGFLEGQGNFGTSIGVDPCGEAAMRYTEVKLTKEMNDTVFRLIKYVPWKDGEIISDKEPVFLPTMVPICLIGNEYTQGIGFGFKTLIPCYRKEDLFNRLLFLLGKRKTKPTIKPITDCDILASDIDLEQLLTTGKAVIKVKGKYTLEPHHNRVILHSWPIGKSFESLIGTRKISGYFESSDIGFDDLSSKNETKISFEVIKQRNRDTIYKSFVKDLESVLIGQISFETIVVNETNGKLEVKPMSIDQMLLDTYKMYTETNKKMLQTEKQNLLNSIEEYKTLLKIRPHLSNEIKNKVLNMKEAVERISNLSKVSIDDVKKLFSKYNINKLLSLEVDEAGLNSEVNYYQSKLDKLEDYVVEQYK